MVQSSTTNRIVNIEGKTEVRPDEVTPLPPVVRCRPSRELWFVVFILAPIGVAMLSSPFWAEQPRVNSTSDMVAIWLLLGFILALFIVPSIILVWWLLRGEIVADENALCWRNWGHRRCARWEQISDFYDCPVPNKKGRKAYIETSDGRMTLRGNSWTNTEMLRTVIAERAMMARVKSWGLIGARDEDDWPRRFDYNTTDNKSMGWMMIAFPVLITGLMAWNFFGGTSGKAVVERADWIFAAAAFIFFTTIYLIILLPLFLIFQETRRRRTQQIIATPDGLQFHDGQNHHSWRWEEITNYYFAAPSGRLQCFSYSVVVSPRGEISFLHTIRDAIVLREIIRHHASAAASDVWKSRDAVEEGIIGGEAARWTGGAAGVGKRIYRYRTRMIRALLWLPSSLFLIPLLLPLISGEHSISESAFMVILMGAIAAYGWWRYHSAAVLIDETGITHKSIFGELTLRWQEVQEYSMIGGDSLQFIELKNNETRLRFWYGVADLEELKSEIQRRAINSRTREWNEIP
jgi:hypothetical protein